jgi:hypothetical protein
LFSEKRHFAITRKRQAFLVMPAMRNRSGSSCGYYPKVNQQNGRRIAMGTKGREIVGMDVQQLLDLLNKAFADEWFAYYQY